MSHLEKRLLRSLGRAARTFDLIAPDDHIMVAVSGGKDSWALLELLTAHRKRVPFDFRITALTLDQGQPGFDARELKAYSKSRGHEHLVIARDTYAVVLDKTPEGKTFCSLCSRMRRGILYTQARELGAHKIALGHHRDDLIETLLLNQFFSGRIRGMAVRLDDPESGIDIIRPLAYCAEADLEAYAASCGVPIIPCNLCGSQSGLERQEVKSLLKELEKRNPRLRGNLLAALGNIDPTHCLDQRLSAQSTETHFDSPLLQIQGDPHSPN